MISRCSFKTHGFTRSVELNGLRIPDCDEGHTVTAGTHHAGCEPHDGVCFFSKCDAIGQLEPQRLVCNQLEMILQQRTSSDQRQPFTLVERPAQAKQRHSQRLFIVLALNRVIDKFPRRVNSRDSLDPIDQRLWNARDFGKWPPSIFLNDPQVSIDSFHQQSRVFNQSTVDASHAHHNHQQQTDSQNRQNEPTDVVLNVLDGEVHRSVTLRPSIVRRATSSTTRTVSPTVRPSITSTC